MTETASAFVPGHVTAFFSVHRREAPAKTGSRGAGITLSDGVTVEVESNEEISIRFDGEPIEMEPVARVLDDLGVEARVEVDADLPLGAGFGVSGSTTLGVALAANHAFDRGLSENELIEFAHVAEVESGTGLGDVVAQARGGIPIRVDPGGPERGKLDGVPETGEIEYVSFGSLSTSDVLAGDTDRLSSAGEDALTALRERPTLDRVVSLGRDFANEAGLLVPQVEEAIAAVREHGGEATMAMLGRTVVALDSGLSNAGYDPESCRVHPAGATLRPKRWRGKV